jgi:hypothetical protein
LRLRTALMFRYHPEVIPPIPRWRYLLAMSKTEIALTILVLVILGFGIWFILSDQIWLLVSYLETLLYPDIVTPQ